MSGKAERYTGLLKTVLRVLAKGVRNVWDANLAEVTRLVNTRGSSNFPFPAHTKPLHVGGGDNYSCALGFSVNFVLLLSGRCWK